MPAHRVHGALEAGVLAEIDAFLQSDKRAWAAQDVEALMQLHSADSEWINACARIFQSREALGGFLRERFFPQFDAAVSQQEMEHLKRVSTRLLGGDAAVLHLYTDADRGAPRNAGWQVVHTVIMGAR